MNLDKHPVFWDIYHVVQAIEACGASPELTAAVIKAGALSEPVEKLVERIAELEAENARLKSKIEGMLSVYERQRDVETALTEAERALENIECEYRGIPKMSETVDALWARLLRIEQYTRRSPRRYSERTWGVTVEYMSICTWFNAGTDKEISKMQNEEGWVLKFITAAHPKENSIHPHWFLWTFCRELPTPQKEET